MRDVVAELEELQQQPWTEEELAPKINEDRPTSRWGNRAFLLFIQKYMRLRDPHVMNLNQAAARAVVGLLSSL
jgi:hypothetical protein